MTPELYYSYQFLKRFKLRTSLANFTYSQSQSDIFYPYFSIYKRTNFSLGIQWEFKKKKKKNWNFYAGASALFVRQQDLYMRRISDLEIETMHSDIRHMLRPVALLGARFKLSPRFSASAESSINIRISPLSRLSINYHF